MKIKGLNFFRFQTILKQLTSAFVAIVIALLATAPAIAQGVAASSNAPRQPAVRSMTSAWVGYAAMTLIFGLILLISLRGSARGEQKS